MLHEKTAVRTFKEVINQEKASCNKCGLVENHCLCPKIQGLKSRCKFVLLTHEREMTRTTNTGRLIEDAILETLTLVWDRTKPDPLLLNLLKSQDYQAYLVFPGDRQEEEKKLVVYEKNNKIPLFIMIDATWKEARKILRKSDYLKDLPILDLKLSNKSIYFLRRHSDDHHLCTAEVGIALLGLIEDEKAKAYLEAYYHRFLTLYEEGRKNENH